MYEVGLAHAVRQSTEILLIRSDDQPINFDIAQINVHRYSLHDLGQTRHQLSRLVADILPQIRQEKALKVQRALDHLDVDTIRYLCDYAIHGPFTGPDPKTMGETLIAIANRAALARAAAARDHSSKSRDRHGKDVVCPYRIWCGGCDAYWSRECCHSTTRSRGRTTSGALLSWRVRCVLQVSDPASQVPSWLPLQPLTPVRGPAAAAVPRFPSCDAISTQMTSNSAWQDASIVVHCVHEC